MVLHCMPREGEGDLCVASKVERIWRMDVALFKSSLGPSAQHLTLQL